MANSRTGVFQCRALIQQSLSIIDYINLNKSKSYARDMHAKVKQRKIILENFAALIIFSLKQREITQVNQQPTKMCCICALNFKKHSDKNIAQATVFKSLTVAVSSKGLVLQIQNKRVAASWGRTHDPRFKVHRNCLGCVVVGIEYKSLKSNSVKQLADHGYCLGCVVVGIEYKSLKSNSVKQLTDHGYCPGCVVVGIEYKSLKSNSANSNMT